MCDAAVKRSSAPSVRLSVSPLTICLACEAETASEGRQCIGKWFNAVHASINHVWRGQVVTLRRQRAVWLWKATGGLTSVIPAAASAREFDGRRSGSVDCHFLLDGSRDPRQLQKGADAIVGQVVRSREARKS